MDRFENGIFGMIKAEDWLEVGYDVNRPNDPVDQVLGDVKTENLIAYWESIAAEYGVPVMAQFHSFDVETQKTIRLPVDVHNIEKGLIKVKIDQSERLRALINRGVVNEQSLYNRVLRDGYNLSEQVFTRSKVAKNELLATGKVTIKENGLNLTVDYGVPESHLNKKLYLGQGNLADQLRAIKQAAVDVGKPITGMYTSSIVWSKLLEDKSLQRLINGTLQEGMMLEEAKLRSYLSRELGITRVLLNDATYSLPLKMGEDGRPITTVKKYYPTDRITFFCSTNKLGDGLWGDPPEVSAAKFMEVSGSEVSPYVVVSQYAENDPAVVWTKASALFMPVLYDPDSIYVATVVDEGGTPDLTIKALPNTVDLWGNDSDDLQTGIMVGDGKILGSLKYLSTGALATDWGAGNFLALQFGGDAFDNAEHIYVGVDPSAGSGLMDIISDPDRASVTKITDKNGQKFKVIVDYGTYTEVKTFDLSGLTLANA